MQADRQVVWKVRRDTRHNDAHLSLSESRVEEGKVLRVAAHTDVRLCASKIAQVVEQVVAEGVRD